MSTITGTRGETLADRLGVAETEVNDVDFDDTPYHTLGESEVQAETHGKSQADTENTNVNTYPNFVPLENRSNSGDGLDGDIEEPLFQNHTHYNLSMPAYSRSRRTNNNSIKFKAKAKEMISTLSESVGDIIKQLLGPCCGQVFVINGNTYQVLRLLGEGGFSYVYLVKSKLTGDLYAVKRIFAQTTDQVNNVRWEVQVHNAFKHANILRLVDFSMTDIGGGRIEALLLFPAYTNGSLLDLLQNPEQEEIFQTTELLMMFRLICDAVLQMHMHKPKWAHRDIKPANILLDDNKLPILMDFGSTSEAVVNIDTRGKGLNVQEHASEHSSMPYRACELWDPATGTTINEKTDVWSLGCLLFAMAYGKGFSPFECTINSLGQPIPADCSYLRVIGNVPFPNSSRHPERMKELISSILIQNPKKRPTLGKVVQSVNSFLEELENVNVIVQH